MERAEEIAALDASAEVPAGAALAKVDAHTDVGARDLVAVTGRGVLCSNARDIEEFARALRFGRTGIRVRTNAGPREPKLAARVEGFDFARWLAELEKFVPEIWARARKILQNVPHATRLAAVATVEAWLEAGLCSYERELAERGHSYAEALATRTGLIVAGSNLNQDYLAENFLAVGTQGKRPNPKYAISYSDSNHVGCLSEILGIRGPGSTIGAASASGNAALFHAWHWVRAGIVDRCVVVGASTTLAAAELQAFVTLGAASLGETPEAGCRPFDKGANGFVWGEGAAVVILERASAMKERAPFRRGEVPLRGYLLGASLLLDARHGPEPSAEAEARAMREALRAAGVGVERIDYINAHGTGSAPGDRAECEAIRAILGSRAVRVPINATKALTGHCLSSAGIVELLACLLQMEAGFVHGNINLEQPIDDQLCFVGKQAEGVPLRVALSNGFGFGGFNTSVVIGNANFPSSSSS